jgi:hypothetical protein
MDGVVLYRQLGKFSRQAVYSFHDLDSRPKLSGTVRYQVFVSSTFIDLREERTEVLQALWELDCIPTGMEAFVATNEAQWEVIQKVIDECDYYVLIIGGRYGSVTAEGISYTEKEYNYAKKLGIPVLGFVHGDPENIIASKIEKDELGRGRLEAFKTRVMKDHPIRKWTSAQELGGLVSRSVSRAIKVDPRPGWVRNVGASSAELLSQINDLTKENLALKAKADLNTGLGVDADELQSGSDKFNLTGVVSVGDTGNYFSEGTSHIWHAELAWDDVFRDIGPLLMNEATELDLRKAMARFVYWSDKRKEIKEGIKSNSITSESFAEIIVQFRALGLIHRGVRKRAVSDKASYWALTERGDRYLVGLLARKKSGAAMTLPAEGALADS